VGEVRQRAELGGVASEVRQQVEKLTQFDLTYDYEPWGEEAEQVRRVRTKAVEIVSIVWVSETATKTWLKARAQSDEDEYVRQAAVGALARGWKDHPDVKSFLATLQR
jgi:hypothetical protein